MKEIEEFYNKIKKIQYGWYDKNKILHERIKDGNFKKDYQMQSIEEIITNNHAICWEMCELERSFFEKNKIPHKVILASLKRKKRYCCHTFVIFQEKESWYWLEASWKNKEGIHKFASETEILEYIRNHFQDFAKEEYDPKKIKFYQYQKPKPKCNANEFYFYCFFKGKKIK